MLQLGGSRLDIRAVWAAPHHHLVSIALEDQVADLPLEFLQYGGPVLLLPFFVSFCFHDE